MTTKAIFLLAGKPDKAIKITVKKLKKLGHHINEEREIPGRQEESSAGKMSRF